MSRMRAGVSAITALALAGLFSLQPQAGARSPDIHGELAVVINMEPSNPRGGDIWLMDLNGRLVRRITKNNYYEEHPKFSPDGSKIAFVRNMGRIVPGVGIDPKYNEVVVYDLRTGAEKRLTRNSVEDGSPEWSFDGGSIAFYSRRNDPQGRATLWVMGADGSHPRQITSLQPGDLSHLEPSWGPDGRWLAFVNYREENGRRYSRVEKVRIDGTQRTVVSSGGIAGGFGDTKESPGDMDPVHSPDGAMIWSARRLKDGQIHLFSFGAGAYYGGKAEIDMNWPVYPGGIERDPQFSPDGSRVVLTRSSLKAGLRNRQVVLTDARASFRRYLTSRADWDAWDPSWYPFAHSGVERESKETLVSYKIGNPDGARALSAQNGDGRSVDHRSNGSGGARLPVSAVQPVNLKTTPVAAYEAGWKLGGSPDRVSSLTLRYQGELRGEDGAGEGSLRLQLMDWETKKWETVFAVPEVAGGKIKIQHEIAPAHFIGGAAHEVKLRVVAFGISTGSTPHSLETDSLSLDVKRDGPGIPPAIAR